MKSSIILIGLPGSGKSTIGVQLAKHLGFDFIDTDILIQSQCHQTLQTILDEQGYLKLREIEETVLLGIHSEHEVIATGGSAVYSDAAMRHLKQLGTIVYLKVSAETVLKRIGKAATRGIARAPDQSLEEVIEERLPLYEQYADISIVNEAFQGIETIAEQISHQ